MSAGDGSGHRLGVETASGGPDALPQHGSQVHELQPTGLTEDGRYVLLETADDTGEQFRVRADERLRGLSRGATGVSNPYQPRVDSSLTPREIQARLRAGQTASEVARAAGVPVERIQRYEAPVLAERGRVVEQAQAARPPVRAEEPRRPLGEIVAERLAQMGLSEDAVQWDAWRRADGTWTIQMAFPRDGSTVTACWLWDPAVGRVRPHDDEAANLLEPPPAFPAPSAPWQTAGPPAASVAPGPTAAAAAAPPAPAAAAPPAPAAAAPAQSGPPPAEATGMPATDVPGATTAAKAPAPPAPEVAPAGTEPAPEAVPLTLVPASEPEAADQGDDTARGSGEGEIGRRTGAPRAAGRRGRREVPAWDDIVFGAKGS